MRKRRKREKRKEKRKLNSRNPLFSLELSNAIIERAGAAEIKRQLKDRPQTGTTRHHWPLLQVLMHVCTSCVYALAPVSSLPSLISVPIKGAPAQEAETSPKTLPIRSLPMRKRCDPILGPMLIGILAVRAHYTSAIWLAAGSWLFSVWDRPKSRQGYEYVLAWQHDFGFRISFLDINLEI